MAEETAKPKTDAALPSVEAPSISPAESAAEASAEPVAALATASPDAPVEAPVETAQPASWLKWLKPQPAVLAASIVLAAALGGVFGAFAIGAKPKDFTAEHERQAMQQALARLTKDLVVLKGELASTEKIAKAQTARVSDLDKRLQEKLARNETIVTGSIAAPPTTPAAVAPVAPPTTAVAAIPPSPAPVASAPLPLPRPAVQNASPREGIAAGWTVLGMHRGFVYVQSGRNIYRVAPGARLPGLGVVEEIRREHGEWIVFTRRGTIVASRERYRQPLAHLNPPMPD